MFGNQSLDRVRSVRAYFCLQEYGLKTMQQFAPVPGTGQQYVICLHELKEIQSLQHRVHAQPNGGFYRSDTPTRS